MKRRRLRVRLEFVLADLWVGLYVRRQLLAPGGYGGAYGRPMLYTCYVCLVPCLPIVVQWRGRPQRV